MSQTLKTSRTKMTEVDTEVEYSIDLETCDFIEVGSACEKLLDLPGYFLRSLSLEGFVKRIHPVDLKRVNATFDQLCPQKPLLEKIKYRFLSGSGDYVWLSDERELVCGREGAISGIRGVLRVLK